MNDFEKIRTLMQDEDVKEFIEPLFLYLKGTMNISPAINERGRFEDMPTMFLPRGFSNIHENVAIACTDLRSIGRCFNEYLETADAKVVYIASSFSKPKTLREEYFKVKNPVFKNFLDAKETPPRCVNIATEVAVVDAIGYSIILTLLEAKKTTIKLSDDLNDLLRQIKNPLWARFIDPICRDAEVFDLTFKLPGLYLFREYAYNTTGGHPCNTFLAIESSVGCRIKEDLPSRTELLSVIEKAFSDFRDLETLTIEEKSLEKLVPCLIKSEETATYLKDLPEQDYLNKLVSEGLLKVYPDRRVTPAKNINSYKFTEMLNEVQQKQRKVAREWLNSLVRLPKKVEREEKINQDTIQRNSSAPFLKIKHFFKKPPAFRLSL